MYRVLIVDDEVPFLQSLEEFEWEKYDCRCVGKATNGEEALAKCHKLAPHIVISDINMPVVDGLSLLSAIQNEYPEIQVILLTVHRDFDYARQAIKLGACDYLVKDMDFRLQLPAVLEKAKKYFEQPIKLNSLARLLHKSGHMLVLESSDVLKAYSEEINNFLKKFSGTLITARLLYPCESIYQLITALDSMPGLIEEGVGLIVRSRYCFELILKQSLQNSVAWLKKIIEENKAQLNLNNINYAVTSLGEGVNGYIDAHNANMLMIERGFYKKQPKIILTTKTEFETLRDDVLKDLLRRAELLIGGEKAAEKFIFDIKEEAIKKNYLPKMVRSAFNQILYKYEFRYAASADDEAHKYIMDAPDINSLADKVLETLKNIHKNQNNYSYIISRALEYMISNLGNTSLQLNEVAEHVCISPGYLSKKLKEETGQTFQEMLIRLRMEYAADILKNSNKKVFEVAEIVGYENYRSFAAAFSNYFGVSPKKYH